MDNSQVILFPINKVVYNKQKRRQTPRIDSVTECFKEDQAFTQSFNLAPRPPPPAIYRQ
jgi:hypothetical protein